MYYEWEDFVWGVLLTCMLYRMCSPLCWGLKVLPKP
jgi:hypothetical protein